MKLVNKKTGEVKSFRFPNHDYDDDKQYTINMFDYEGNEYNYSTLAELNEEWEDVDGINVTNIEVTNESNYQCQYVACYCPKCRNEIFLKIYARTPILRAGVTEPKAEE